MLIYKYLSFHWQKRHCQSWRENQLWVNSQFYTTFSVLPTDFSPIPLFTGWKVSMYFSLAGFDPSSLSMIMEVTAISPRILVYDQSSRWNRMLCFDAQVLNRLFIGWPKNRLLTSLWFLQYGSIRVLRCMWGERIYLAGNGSLLLGSKYPQGDWNFVSIVKGKSQRKIYN